MGGVVINDVRHFWVIHLKGEIRITGIMFDRGGWKSLIKAFELGGGIKFEIVVWIGG